MQCMRFLPQRDIERAEGAGIDTQLPLAFKWDAEQVAYGRLEPGHRGSSAAYPVLSISRASVNVLGLRIQPAALFCKGLAPLPLNTL